MKRSKHSLSHFRLTSFNMGEICPIACMEILPGDSFRMQSQALIRVAPLVSPVMHPVRVLIHHWFVPNRLLWQKWEQFIVNIDSPLAIPTVDASTCAVMSRDLGVGVSETAPPAYLVNALPFRAYNLIYNEFYRDQDIGTSIWTEGTSDNDGPDPGARYVRRNAMWEKDYFTTARPTPQKGNDQVVTVPVTGISGATGTGTMKMTDWRLAMSKQKITEHRNWFGSRYKDYLAFLGVNSSDARLGRPEFLGGGSQMISFSEVLSTAETTGAVVGDMAGHGIGAVTTVPFKRFFEEHGWILSFMIVRPKNMYLSTVNRSFITLLSSQMWQKELEMNVAESRGNREIYYPATAGAFGYGGNYDHYRRRHSYVSGEFRTTLKDWHYARDFSSQPALNETFLQCVPTTRVYADANAAQLRVMVNHRVSARRLVSKHARVM